MADAWWEDLKLREDMERYVRQGYKGEEALDFLKHSFVRQTSWKTSWVSCHAQEKGLEARGGIGAKKKRKKGNFSLKGPNFVHSLDGHANLHDKMMGYQNSTFPLAV
ncbi:unnamed protein product [Porites lobata]|uniref:Uncharacterized protein n=1 Tax=Porites lobata TaxID=104759 RepID=A0ABN8QH02_9CNID|nr:unnamed protein product [Porites lobata]